MDAASVGPSEFEHVIEVVGNTEQFLLTVVGGRNGMEQEVGFWSGADNVAVAVGAVTQNRACDVGAVAVVVFGIVATRAQTVGCAHRGRWREGKNTLDVVSEIGVHVGVVHTVVKSCVGDGDDDAASIQPRPGTVDVAHDGVVPGIVNVHHFNAL